MKAFYETGAFPGSKPLPLNPIMSLLAFTVFMSLFVLCVVLAIHHTLVFAVLLSAYFAFFYGMKVGN